MESTLKSKRNRKAPVEWSDVFSIVHRTKLNRFKTQDVRRAMSKEHLKISDASLQVKLAKYVAKQYLSKHGRDDFYIDRKGMAFFGLKPLYNGSEEDY